MAAACNAIQHSTFPSYLQHTCTLAHCNTLAHLHISILLATHLHTCTLAHFHPTCNTLAHLHTCALAHLHNTCTLQHTSILATCSQLLCNSVSLGYYSTGKVVVIRKFTIARHPVAIFQLLGRFSSVCYCSI